VHDDGDRAGGVSERSRPVGAGRENKVEIQIHQLGYMLGQPLGASFVAPPLDEDGLAFHVAQRGQLLGEQWVCGADPQMPNAGDRWLA